MSEPTDEELNVRLGELLGFELLLPPHNGRVMYRIPIQDYDGATDWLILPRYCSDLNAVAEVERGLTDEQRGDFINSLCTICEPDRSKPGTAMSKAFFATARQRTLALIETLKP